MIMNCLHYCMYYCNIIPSHFDKVCLKLLIRTKTRLKWKCFGTLFCLFEVVLEKKMEISVQ